MKKPVLILGLCLCLVIFTAAIGRDSPVLPWKNFYINDYADIISEKYRDSMLEAARELTAETGAQLVLITLDNLGGIDAGEYANQIFGGWNIGGADANGILMLVSAGDGETHILVGRGLSGALTEQELEDIQQNRMRSSFAGGHYNEGIREGFLSVASGIYAEYGIEKHKDFLPIQNEDEEGSNSVMFMVGIALMILVAARILRINVKQTQKRWDDKIAYVKGPPRTMRPEYFDDDYPSGFGGLGSLKDLRVPSEAKDENDELDG